ncbi:MAG TPA: helix-turn-helix domain-containing protein [Burkholderiales bacterium]|nr:helix-turn-helix domain-containing protein [Burkholderiales bacterium]
MTAGRITVRTLRGEAARYEKPQTEREAAIIQAATRLFGERGYDNTRTAQIASMAGVTERTLFRYFPTKNALYRRVMFPVILAAAMRSELTDLGRLFASDSESFADWHRRILKTRIEVAKRAGPQFRVLIATLMTDEVVRRKVITLWKENFWGTAVAAIRRYQRRGQLRSDLRPEAIARAVISVNLGYIVARALLAPEATWNDQAEVDAIVELMMRGAAAIAASSK